MSARLMLCAVTLLAGVFMIAPAMEAADEKPTTRPQRPMGNADPGTFLKMQRARLDQLGLTDDQKKKVDEIFVSAAGDLRKALEETKDLGPQERREKVMPVMVAIRDKVGVVLTEEQKQKLIQMGPMGGPGGRGPTTGRLKENLAKLDLSAEQKTKVEAILAESQKKAEALRAEVENGNADRQKIMEKGQQIGDETRDALKEVLTPAQQEKLRGLMQSDGGPGGQRPGTRGRPGAATRPSN